MRLAGAFAGSAIIKGRAWRLAAPKLLGSPTCDIEPWMERRRFIRRKLRRPGPGTPYHFL